MYASDLSVFLGSLETGSDLEIDHDSEVFFPI